MRWLRHFRRWLGLPSRVDQFTRHARLAVAQARQDCVRLHRDGVDTLDVLAAVLAIEGCTAVALLAAEKEPVASLRDAATAARRPGRSTLTAKELPYSEEFKQVLAYATWEADDLGSALVGTEHLLLGLLRCEECQAFPLLHRRGLALATFRAAARERQQRSPAAAPR